MRLRNRLATWSIVLVFLIAFVCWRKPLIIRLNHARLACVNVLASQLAYTSLMDAGWPEHLFSRYAGLPVFEAANKSIPVNTSGRVVFFGDSITDLWLSNYPQDFFPGRTYLERGIWGQTTQQMLWRFHQDVIELHPATVVLLGGTNDVIWPDDGINYPKTIRNFQQMTASAQHHGIRIILCSVLPVSGFPPTKQAAFTQQIRAINTWLQRFASQKHVTYVDFYLPMSTPSGGMKDDLSVDGVHPNAAGYAIMEPLAQHAIDAPPPN